MKNDMLDNYLTEGNRDIGVVPNTCGIVGSLEVFDLATSKRDKNISFYCAETIEAGPSHFPFYKTMTFGRAVCLVAKNINELKAGRFTVCSRDDWKLLEEEEFLATIKKFGRKKEENQEEE